MQSLDNLVYSPLKEEEGATEGWSKSTIGYVIDNKSRIYQSIGGIARSLGKIIARAEVEDIYSALLEYLYKTDDYNLSKAIVGGNVVSFEGYVYSCTKYCVIRHVTKMYSDEKHSISENIKDESGKDISLFDTIPDKEDPELTNFTYNLDDMCRQYRSERYVYGNDIYLIWYIRLRTNLENKADKFKEILDVLGIKRSDIISFEKHAAQDDLMLEIAKAITLTGMEKSADILRNYIYFINKIDMMIASY